MSAYGIYTHTFFAADRPPPSVTAVANKQGIWWA